MARYGSVTISGSASLIARVVESADPSDLANRANAALVALPTGYTVVGLSLAGAGDGHTFTLTIEAGAVADTVGGFLSLPSVACYLASDAESLGTAYAAAVPTSGTVADNQVAGASKGTRFMGAIVSGVLSGGGSGSGGNLTADVVDTGTPSGSKLVDINTTTLPNGTIANVNSVGDYFDLETNPSAAVIAATDGITIAQPTTVSTYRWVRRLFPSLRFAFQSLWFLDPAGDDDNDGLTAITPLQTMAELSRRLKGAKINANTTIGLAAGVYADPVKFDLTINQGISVSMNGFVSSISDTISVILPTVAGAASTNAGAQRGTVTSTTGAFTDRQRLRITSAGASSGATAFVTRVTTPGAGGVANVTRWGKLPNPLTSTTVTLVAPSANDTFAYDSLDSQIGYLDIRVRGAGRFVIQDCLIRPPETVTVTHRCLCDNGNVNGFMAYNCIFQAASSVVIQGGEWAAACCSFASDINNIAMSQNFLEVRKCVFAGATINLQTGGYLQQGQTACIDGGNVIIQSGGVWDQIGASTDTEFVDGTAANAVEVAQGGMWWAHSTGNLQWGLNNAYSGVAYRIDVGGSAFYNSSIPSVPGGTGSDWTVGTLSGAWATLPVIITTAAAGTAASAGASAVFSSQS